MQDGSRKAIIAAFFANLGIAIAKFIGFVITGSAGLLAEAAHSVADTGNQGLLMFGSKRGKRPADRAHPFGYGPERYFWAFIVALVLFSMGGLFALYEGIQKLIHPHEVENAIVAYVILGVAIALETFSLRTAVREANHSRGNRSMAKFVRDARQPELPVILLEDAGALVGLLFALIGVGLAVLTGNGRFDAMGAMAVGTLLVVIAIFLAMEMTAMLVGESALPEQVEAIRTALEDSEGVERVIHLRTLHVGPDELLVAAKIAVAHGDTGAEIAADIDAAEAAVRAAVPTATYIFLEPDLDRSTPKA